MEKGVSKLYQDCPSFGGCGGVKMLPCYRKVLIAQQLRDPNKTCHLTPGALFSCQTRCGRAGGVLCPGLMLHVVLTAVNDLVISLSFLLYLSWYLDIKSTCGSKSEAPVLQRGMAHDQRSWLWLSGAKPQLRIGLTARWQTVRSQECRPVRWHLCGEGQETGVWKEDLS